MSETNAENDPQTTEEPIENNEGPVEASWDDAQSHNQRLKSQRKTIDIAFPEDPDKFVRFEYRMLSESEIDEAENAAVNIQTSRNKQEITTDSGALRKVLIKHGVTEGPEGFKATERYVESMPTWIKRPLADAIENFTEMPEEAREGF